jgi:hypothetical protein
MTHNHNLKTDNSVIQEAPARKKKVSKAAEAKFKTLETIPVGQGFYLIGPMASFRAVIAKFNKSGSGKFTVYTSENGNPFAKRVS